MSAPVAFHVLAKPVGAACNLGCRYCFYLEKECLYPGSHFQMSDDTLEAYIRQYLELQRVSYAILAWQGGEPTLIGIDFYRRSVALVEKYRRPGQRVQYAIQTNGTLLDDEWCALFRQHGFLVGISIDGPPNLHNAYRVDKGGNPSFHRVRRGLELLKKHQVEYNILAAIHAANEAYPLEVYRFFRDDLKARFIQFIPIVEPEHGARPGEGARVSAASVKPERYGAFLSHVFDEWIRRDVGTVFVQIFDEALAAWAGARPTLCVFAPTCGHALALEHNGDLYSCDHFVEPTHYLGNIKDTPMAELVASEKQRRFGLAKRDTLPLDCRTCRVRFICQGGCPKDRLTTAPDGTPGLNYLCAGYKAFFQHVDRPMQVMASLLQRGRAPAEVINLLASRRATLGPALAGGQAGDSMSRQGRSRRAPPADGRAAGGRSRR